MPPVSLILTFALIAAIAPPASESEVHPAAAPSGAPGTRYCMRVEAVTGSRLEHVICWTRAEWTDQGVDLDRDWPTEGVRTIG